MTTRTDATVTGDYTPGYDGAELSAPELAVGGRAKVRGFEWRWLVSFPAMLGAMLVGASFVVVRAFNVDPDLWWHVKTGELILSTHKWATTDPYSYTSYGAPWMSCEWLGDVLFAAVYRVGGLRGLEALLFVLASAVMLALYGLATQRSGNSKAGFVAAAVLLALATVSFNLRPQMLGYLFLILTLVALERFRQGKGRAIWLLPVLFLIWINTHGSWIIGLGVIGLYIACGLVDFQMGSLEARRWSKSERLRLETVFMLCLAAISITPYGTRLAMYPFTVASSLPVSMASILEWQVMPFNLMGGKIFLALILVFFFMQMVFRFSWQLFEVLLFMFGVAMACIHARFLLLFVPFFAPLLATMVARWFSGYDKAKDQYLLNFALMLGLAIAVVHYFPSQMDIEKAVAEKSPVQALAYMSEHPVPGPIFNAYGFGGYMIFSGYKTFIDGRSELFEQTGILSDYMHITLLKPGAIKILGNYGIRACIMERDEPLSTALATMPDWQTVYSDPVSVIFVKRDALQAAVQPAREIAAGSTR
ncbi:MAG TPA: hypothetical protein VOA88_04760 [Candidatus Dormibacteraeota bacterium]|nr:hypothetical protein [Candidatus Dormibacteraeota bacterium]